MKKLVLIVAFLFAIFAVHANDVLNYKLFVDGKVVTSEEGVNCYDFTTMEIEFDISEELYGYQNVVIYVVVDGLPYEYSVPQDVFARKFKNKRGKVTVLENGVDSNFRGNFRSYGREQNHPLTKKILQYISYNEAKVKTGKNFNKKFKVGISGMDIIGRYPYEEAKFYPHGFKEYKHKSNLFLAEKTKIIVKEKFIARNRHIKLPPFEVPEVDCQSENLFTIVYSKQIGSSILDANAVIIDAWGSIAIDAKTGKKEGAFQEYVFDEDSNTKSLIAEGEYRNNKKHGLWKTYKDGQLKKEVTYNNGKKVKK